MVHKTRHEQQIVPKSSPIGQGFLGSRVVLKGLGTQRFDKKRGQEAVWAKVVRAKSGQKDKKTWKKQKNTLPFTQNKQMKKQIKKMENISPPPSQTKKNEKVLKERKSNQNIVQTRKNIFSYSSSSSFFEFFDFCEFWKFV